MNGIFKHVTASFIGAHQLLPSSKYFELANELAAPDPMTEDDRDLNGDGTSSPSPILRCVGW